MLEPSYAVSASAIDCIKAWLDNRSWVLIWPDLDRRLCHITAEAGLAAEAQELVDTNRQAVTEIQG